MFLLKQKKRFSVSKNDPVKRFLKTVLAMQAGDSPYMEMVPLDYCNYSFDKPNLIFTGIYLP